MYMFQASHCSEPLLQGRLPRFVPELPDNQAALHALIQEVGVHAFIRAFTPQTCRALLGRADLHVHSLYSDGSDPPAEIVQQAASRGLALLNLSDHDDPRGWGEAHAAAQSAAITVTAGIEFSSRIDHTDVHILAIAIDTDKAAAATLFRDLAKLRAARDRHHQLLLERMMAKLLREERTFGSEHVVTFADVKRRAGSAAVNMLHIQLALERQLRQVGCANSRELAQAWCAKGLPGGSVEVPFEAHMLYPATEAIRTIVELGGIPVLAHPQEYRAANALSFEQLRQLKAAGLQGIEIFNGCAPHARSLKEWIALAEQLTLFPTMGSDYHGLHKNRILGQYHT